MLNFQGVNYKHHASLSILSQKVVVVLHTATLHSIIHGPVSPWQRVGIGQNFRTEESLRYRADLEEEARQKEEQRWGIYDWKSPALLEVSKMFDRRFDQLVSVIISICLCAICCVYSVFIHNIRCSLLLWACAGWRQMVVAMLLQHLL